MSSNDNNLSPDSIQDKNLDSGWYPPRHAESFRLSQDYSSPVSPAITNKWPILTQPYPNSVPESPFYGLRNYGLDSGSLGRSTDSVLERQESTEHDVPELFEVLRDVSRCFFNATGRVDTARCKILIENERKDNIYEVQINSKGALFDPHHPNQVPRRSFRDLGEAMGAQQNLEVAESASVTFKDFETSELVMTVGEENGSMVARSRGQPVGVVQEDKWYNTPNFTAISSTNSASFLTQSSEGCFALNWAPWFSKPEFRISSSGLEIGSIGRIVDSENQERFCVCFTRSLDVKSKALLLGVSVLVYIAHFGETGCGNCGSSGVRGSCCCCSFL